MPATATKKTGKATPSDQTKKNAENTSEQSEIPESNLAAGIVGKTGEIVDDAGNTVGKITEGEPGDLVGNVVTATGDIIGKDGGIVGKALPLGDDGEEKSGSFSLLGAAKGVKGVVDTADGTVQTVNRTVPLVGDVTKGLGLGGDKEGGVLSGVLGSKSEDRDAQEKQETTEAAKKELLGDAGDQTEVESKSQPPQSDTDSRPELTEQSEDAEDDATVKAKDTTDDVKDTANTATDGAKDTAEGATDNVKDTAEGTTDKVQDATDNVTDENKDVSEKAGGLTDSVTGAVGDATEKVGDTVGDATKGATDTVGETTDKVGETAGDVTEGAKDTVEGTTDEAKPDESKDVTDDVKDTAEGATDKVGETTDEAKPDDSKDVTDDVKDTAEGATDKVGETTDEAKDKAEDATDEAKDTAEDATDKVGETTDEAKDKVDETTDEAKPDDSKDVTDDVKDTAEDAIDKVGETTDEAKDKAEDATDEAKDKADEATDKVDETTDEAKDKAEDATDEAKDKVDETAEDAKPDEAKDVTDDVKDTAEDAQDEAKDAADDTKSKLGSVDDIETVTIPGDKLPNPFERFEGAEIDDEGKVIFEEGSIGRVVEGNPEDLAGQTIGPDGAVLNDDGSEIGRVELKSEIAEELIAEAKDFSILKGAKVNKAGNLVNEKGDAIGRLTEGILKNLIGRKADENGEIWNDSGKVVGKAEPIPENELAEQKGDAPFEDFPGALVQSNGDVTYEGEVIGKVVEGDAKQLKGKTVDEDGEILDRNGNSIGRAERWEAEEPEEEPEVEVDNSLLAGKRVNKAGNVVDSNGNIFGRVVEGDLKRVAGCMCDKKGNIMSESGDVLGRAELIPEGERESKKEGPFTDFPEAVVEANGDVVSDGDVIGKVVEGDAKKLRGKKVDADGDILDSNGNRVGRAERWEPEDEPEVDNSLLAGKRVNKAGNVVDSNGSIFGRLVEGDAQRLAGRMCDKKGNVLSESGDIIGRAEVISEGEREGLKEGPFAELPGCTVNKEGHVVTPGGDIVGRLVSGDPKVLFGRAVDGDGEVLDRNGNSIGKAERWEPEPEPEKKKGPMAGRRVNKKGEVNDEDGNIIGKLTSGELSICAGKEVDDDGDVVDGKGNTVGHVSLIDDIPEEVEEETEEAKKEREQAEEDEKLAKNLSYQIDQGLEKIRPICKQINDKIDKAEATPKEELDEEELVRQVKPLIEEGGRILSEINGTIRGLDPDGRIQRQAKQKSGTREATDAEHHLAELLKELTGTVTVCVDSAKKKLEGMPHAKKELSPLWGLLTEPLFQILAAVGLLLTGVLNLVGRLLSGLGLGGIVDGLLGSLGLNRLLDSLGLGSITGALTGKNQKDGGKKKGGLGILGL